jgi:uncharacterized protein
LIEWLTGLTGQERFLYRRRVLFTTLVEIPLAIFLLAPYFFTLELLAAHPRTVCCVTPLDYGAKNYENVHISTRDGTSLAGWYVPPRDNPGPLIVLLHGAGGDRRGCEWHFRQLLQAGYGILIYDQRALGESGGKSTSFGWLDASDLLDALDWLASRPEVAPGRIGALGLSGGGNIAVNAAYLAPQRLAALWVDGLGAQTIEDFPQPRSAGESFITFLNRIILRMAEFQLGRRSPPSFSTILAGWSQPPLVLVAGGLDDFEKRTNLKFAQILPPQVKFWLIPNAGHVGGSSIAPDEYRTRMLDFFARNLGTPGKAWRNFSAKGAD